MITALIREILNVVKARMRSKMIIKRSEKTFRGSSSTYKFQASYREVGKKQEQR